MAKRKKKFNIQPRITVPTVVPYLIEGEDVPAILDEVNGVIDSEFNGNKNLKVLNLRKNGDKQVVTGSNSLVLPVVAQVVSPQFRVMRPEKLETTLQEGDPIGIKGNHYVDYGIVLDFSGNNHASALAFYEQLPKELRDFDRLPAVVVGYGLANSEAGDYSVCPIFTDGTEIRTVKVFAGKTGDFDANDTELTHSGVPSKVGSGARRLYTASQSKPSLDNLGLSGLSLDGGLNLDSSNRYLALSYGDGRVVLESGEADARDFSVKLERTYTKKKSELSERFEKARQALDKGYEEACEQLRKQ